MYSVGDTKYGLCFFQNEELISFCEYNSVRDAKDLVRKNNLDYLIFGCKEISETKKLVWLVDNNISENNDDANLLFKIYSDLFSFNDAWKKQNV
tara:strand:+ start:24924 stop:25205 length:282 start_codon:yes stop_codon:yes gene_type:complete